MWKATALSVSGFSEGQRRAQQQGRLQRAKVGGVGGAINYDRLDLLDVERGQMAPAQRQSMDLADAPVSKAARHARRHRPFVHAPQPRSPPNLGASLILDACRTVYDAPDTGSEGIWLVLKIAPHGR